MVWIYRKWRLLCKRLIQLRTARWSKMAQKSYKILWKTSLFQPFISLTHPIFVLFWQQTTFEELELKFHKKYTYFRGSCFRSLATAIFFMIFVSKVRIVFRNLYSHICNITRSCEHGAGYSFWPRAMKFFTKIDLVKISTAIIEKVHR